MKTEVNNLIKIGISEDLALMSVCRKYGKEHLVEDILLEKKQEQDLLKEELEKFVPFTLAGANGAVQGRSQDFREPKE